MIRFRPLAFALLMTSTAALAEGPKLIPMPVSIETRAGTLTIGEGTGIVATDAGAKTAARLLVQQVKVARGLTLVGDAATGPTVGGGWPANHVKVRLALPPRPSSARATTE